MSETLPGIRDEKLEDYLSVWKKLIASDYRSQMDVTLTMDFHCDRPLQWLYTLTYGEEKRELTREQAYRVKDWLDSLR
jgi:hypothetical protein